MNINRRIPSCLTWFPGFISQLPQEKRVSMQWCSNWSCRCNCDLQWIDLGKPIINIVYKMSNASVLEHVTIIDSEAEETTSPLAQLWTETKRTSQLSTSRCWANIELGGTQWRPGKRMWHRWRGWSIRIRRLFRFDWKSHLIPLQEFQDLDLWFECKIGILHPTTDNKTSAEDQN